VRTSASFSDLEAFDLQLDPAWTKPWLSWA